MTGGGSLTTLRRLHRTADTQSSRKTARRAALGADLRVDVSGGRLGVLWYPEKLGRHGVGFLRCPDKLGRHGVGFAQADRLDVIRYPEEFGRRGVGLGETRGALGSRGGIEGRLGKQNRHHRRQRQKFARIHLGLLFLSNRLLMLEGRHLRRVFAVRTSGFVTKLRAPVNSKTGARKNETFLHCGLRTPDDAARSGAQSFRITPFL